MTTRHEANSKPLQKGRFVSRDDDKVRSKLKPHVIKKTPSLRGTKQTIKVVEKLTILLIKLKYHLFNQHKKYLHYFERRSDPKRSTKILSLL